MYRKECLLTYSILLCCLGRGVFANPLLRDKTTTTTDQWSSSTTDQWSSSYGDTFKQLRFMLNERLLANGASKTGENYKYSGSSPSQLIEDSGEETTADLDEKYSQNFVLVAAINESGNSKDNHFVLKRADTESDSTSITTAKIRHQTRRKEERQRRQRMRDQLEEYPPMSDEPRAQIMPTLQLNSNSQKLQKVQSLRRLQRQRQEESRRFLAELAKTDHDCPKHRGGGKQVLCPSRGRHGYRVCIPDRSLCNGIPDCPNGEDEDPTNCLFYKTTIHHFQLIVDAVVEMSDVLKRHEKMHTLDEL